MTLLYFDMEDKNLCLQCSKIQVSESTSWNSQPYILHASLDGFLLAVGEECTFCVLLYNRMSGTLPKPQKLIPSLWKSLQYRITRDKFVDYHYRLQVNYPGLFSPHTDGIIIFRLLLPKKLQELSFNILEFASETSTGSSSSLTKAYQWNQCCQNSHFKCVQYSSNTKSWLPSRLIDVGDDNCMNWRLRITAEELNDLSLSPQYLALSYKWGSNPKLLLLKSTLADFRKGRPTKELPKTFFDLVHVARQFSVRYVWIDSLCIIQDSKEDWDAEAPTMRIVYANSMCTIVASSSPDADGGLFKPREKGVSPPQYVTLPLVTTHGQQAQQFFVVEKDYWHRSIGSGPLYRRGWVFQERYLSRRLLYFTEDQIMFECLTGARCEVFPKGLPHHFPDKNLDALWRYAETKETLVSYPTPRSIQLLWRNLVKDYSECSFTHATDKLPAFSGIAKLFQEVTGDEYIAGLWKSNLPEGLDWRVYDPRPETCQKYRPPSWSWASIDGPVRPSIPDLSSRQLVTMVDVGIDLYGTDPTGAVTGGHITLEGVLTRARKVCIRDNKESLLLIGSNYASVRLFLDKMSTDTDIQNGQLVDCLILNVETSSDGSTRNNPEVCVLLLLPVSHLTHSAHRRIGHFTLEDPEILAWFGVILDVDGSCTLSPERERSRITII